MTHHLAEHRLPLWFAVFATNAVSGQTVVTTFADFFGLGTQQNVDQMTRTKPFFGTQNSGQRFAHSDRTVEHIHRRIAQITLATGHFRFIKIGQQVLAAAFQGLSQSKQRIQTCVIRCAAFGWGYPFINLIAA